MGAAHALGRPPMHAPTDIHGESGLDGTALLPVPAVPPRASPPAVAAAAAALAAAPPGTAWVVATGAFTNVAGLFAAHPALAAHVRGLALMGGALGGAFTPAVLGAVAGLPRLGNRTPFAEFNVLADPEAAARLFAHPQLAPKTTLVPLDLTHLVLATAEVRALLLYGPEGPREGPGKSTLRIMLVELLMFFAKTYA